MRDRLLLAIPLLFTALVVTLAVLFSGVPGVPALAQSPSAAVGGGGAWVKANPEDAVRLGWITETESFPDIEGVEREFHDEFNMHPDAPIRSDGEPCIVVPSTRMWNIYAEVAFELDENGTRSVAIVARSPDGGGRLLGGGSSNEPDPTIQMRVAEQLSAHLEYGTCIEVWARAKGHTGRESFLYVQGVIFEVW